MSRLLKASNRWHHWHCTGINKQPICLQLNMLLTRLDAHRVRINKRRTAINNHHTRVIREHVVVLIIKLRYDRCLARKRFIDRLAGRCRTHQRFSRNTRNINTRPTIHLRRLLHQRYPLTCPGERYR